MNLSDARVMVVEDDALMRSFTVSLLRRLGIVHLHESADGTAGLKSVSTFQPDVVLTDIHMKPMDGLEFVKRLNSSPGNHARVIFMSADSSRETFSAALPLGVVAYIVKPPRLTDLKNKIEAALAGL